MIVHQTSIMSAADQAKDKAAQAKQQAQEGKNTLLKKLEDDGVVNPKGLAMFGFTGLFLAGVPVTSWIAQPGGMLEKAVNGVCSAVAFVGSAGSTSAVPQTGKIAALGTLYLVVTYALSGAGHAAAVDAGNKEGRDNEHPRAQIKNLTGLPLRLHSAHHHLVEFFPGFALTAALSQAVAPGDQTLINLLGLHVLSKVFVHYPSYIFNIGVPRTLSHVVATASVINVALKLSRKSLV